MQHIGLVRFPENLTADVLVTSVFVRLQPQRNSGPMQEKERAKAVYDNFEYLSSF